MSFKVAPNVDNVPEDGGVDLREFETMSPKLEKEFAPSLL